MPQSYDLKCSCSSKKKCCSSCINFKFDLYLYEHRMSQQKDSHFANTYITIAKSSNFFFFFFSVNEENGARKILANILAVPSNQLILLDVLAFYFKIQFLKNSEESESNECLKTTKV